MRRQTLRGQKARLNLNKRRRRAFRPRGENLEDRRLLAATFTVNSIADEVDSVPGNGLCETVSGVCTLRAAIGEANALAGPDTIVLPAGTYTLSREGREENANQFGDLDITEDLTIQGEGATTTVIDARGIDRVMEVISATQVDISGVTLRGGFGPHGAGLSIRSGSATIQNSVFTDHDAAGDGGGISYISPAPAQLTLTNVTLSNNLAPRGGGLASTGRAVITRSTIRDNAVANHYGGATGGGIYSSGTLILDRSQVVNNRAGNDSSEGSGGGIYNEGTATILRSLVQSNTAFQDVGGGIANRGQLTVVDSTIDQNTSAMGGGIYHEGTLRTTEISTSRSRRRI